MNGSTTEIFLSFRRSVLLNSCKLIKSVWIHKFSCRSKEIQKGSVSGTCCTSWNLQKLVPILFRGHLSYFMLQLCENRAQMNEKSYEAAAGLVSKTYVDQGRDARKTHEKHIQVLLQQVGKNTLGIGSKVI